MHRRSCHPAQLIATAAAACAAADATSASTAAEVTKRLQRAEKRLRRHLHHALFVGLVLTRPFYAPAGPKQQPTPAPIVAVMAMNENATSYLPH